MVYLIGPEFWKTVCGWRKRQGPTSKSSAFLQYFTTQDGETNLSTPITVSEGPISPPNFGENLFDLPDDDFNLLYRACAGHTDELTHPNITIQTCWDSDRLDLGRVGIMPHPSRLCTEVAKKKETIQWADGRASFGFVPEFVSSEWEVERARAS